MFPAFPSSDLFLRARCHELYQKTRPWLVEAGKISLVVATLSLSTHFFLPAKLVVPQFGMIHAVRPITVSAPFWEELVFRGELQGGMESMQHWLGYDAQSCGARRCRNYVTSALFGLAHITNPGPLAIRLSVVVFATLGGSILSYLKEKHGMAAAIAAHGVNNFSSMLMISPTAPNLFKIALRYSVLDCGVFLWRKKEQWLNTPLADQGDDVNIS